MTEATWQSKPPTEPGYYWVVMGDEFFPARYDLVCNWWTIVGTDEIYDAKDFRMFLKMDIPPAPEQCITLF